MNPTFQNLKLTNPRSPNFGEDNNDSLHERGL